MGEIETAKKLHQFRQDRKDARDVLRLKLFSDALKVKQLDKHIDEFLSLIKKDTKKHDIKDLKKHATEFEREVHDELSYLLNLTQEDLKLYIRVLKALHSFKVEIKRYSKEDTSFSKLAKAELKYAEVITKAAHHKLDSLHILFKRLENS